MELTEKQHIAWAKKVYYKSKKKEAEVKIETKVKELNNTSNPDVKNEEKAKNEITKKPKFNLRDYLYLKNSILDGYVLRKIKFGGYKDLETIKEYIVKNLTTTSTYSNIPIVLTNTNLILDNVIDHYNNKKTFLYTYMTPSNRHYQAVLFKYSKNTDKYERFYINPCGDDNNCAIDLIVRATYICNNPDIIPDSVIKISDKINDEQLQSATKEEMYDTEGRKHKRYSQSLLRKRLKISLIVTNVFLSLIHISEPTRQDTRSRMPSSA